MAAKPRFDTSRKLHELSPREVGRMSKKKKAKKRLEARRAGAEAQQGGAPTMRADTGRADEPGGDRTWDASAGDGHSDHSASEQHEALLDGVAAVGPVTDEMMDHAAHEAAALADGVARGTVETVREAPRPTAEAREAPGRAAPSGPDNALSRYNAKVVEVMRANAAATTSLFVALVQARSIPEAMALNADHLRRQMEALESQGRDLAVLAQRVALDALRPPGEPGER